MLPNNFKHRNKRIKKYIEEETTDLTAIHQNVKLLGNYKLNLEVIINTERYDILAITLDNRIVK